MQGAQPAAQGKQLDYTRINKKRTTLFHLPKLVKLIVKDILNLLFKTIIHS